MDEEKALKTAKKLLKKNESSSMKLKVLAKQVADKLGDGENYKKVKKLIEKRRLQLSSTKKSDYYRQGRRVSTSFLCRRLFLPVLTRQFILKDIYRKFHAERNWKLCVVEIMVWRTSYSNSGLIWRVMV